jgi:restriction endonuclease S subunit
VTWPVVALDDVAASEPRAITDGPFGSNLASRHYTEVGPRVVRLQNIGDGRFVDARAHISQEHFDSLRAHEVQGGDLLVASLGEVLPRACLAPDWLGPAIVKADCIRVRLSDAVDPRWVLYALQRPAVRRWAEEHRHGVGRPRLGLKTIRAIPLPLPPLDEQRRIVDLLEDHLSRLDAASNYLAVGKRRLDVMVSSVLLDLIPDQSAYPDSWKRATVAEAGTIGLGRQRHPDWHTGPNMRPYLRVANVFEDRLDTSDVMEMHWPEDTFARFKLRPGDVLLNEGQTPDLLGRPAIYRGDPPETAFTNSLIRFKANHDVLPEFALLVFRRHMRAGRFKRASRITTNIAHLSAARLKPIEFPIPPIQEQERIVGVAAERLDAVKRLDAELAVASGYQSNLRRSLLAAAFSGRLTGAAPDVTGTDVVEELAGV